MNPSFFILESIQPGQSHTSPISHPPQPSPPQSHTSLPSSVTEEAILQIVSMGFPRHEAVQELTRKNGNVELALAALLARSL